MKKAELIEKYRFITRYPDLFAAAVESMVDEDDMRQATPIKTVVIDGVEYIPRNTVMPDEALEFMSQLYGLIWIESCYDPYSEATRAFAEKCWPHINMLNQIFKFRK